MFQSLRQHQCRLRYLASCLAVLCLLHESAHAVDNDTERVTWRYRPIEVGLTVGEERQLHFPAAVSVGLPASLDAVLRTQTVNGTVYWLAHAPFAKTRVQIREVDSGHVYLFDLEGGDAPRSNHPLAIQRDGTAPGNGAARGGPASFDFVTLTRMAAQALYAPTRLVTALPGVSRVAVSTNEVDLLPYEAVTAEPLIGWRSDAYYLTAVKLTNQHTETVTLDPRHLKGQWLSATFQHARLGPAESLSASTVVYLISAKPLAAAL